MRLSKRARFSERSVIEEEPRDRGVAREEVTEVLPVGTAVAPEGVGPGRPKHARLSRAHARAYAREAGPRGRG